MLNRRQFFGAAAGAAVLMRNTKAFAAEPVKYDLIVKGGRVIDPSLKLDAIHDVAIAGRELNDRLDSLFHHPDRARQRRDLDRGGLIVGDVGSVHEPGEGPRRPPHRFGVGVEGGTQLGGNHELTRRQHVAQAQYPPTVRSAASTAFRNNMAIVVGPTPPMRGVM